MHPTYPALQVQLNMFIHSKMLASGLERYKSVVRDILYWLTSSTRVRNSIRLLARVGLVPSFVWRRLPVDAFFSVDIEKGTSISYRSTRFDLIGRVLFWKGVEGFEPETIRLFRTVIRKADLFLDVGANTGIYSLVACALNPSIEVFAFEPVPRVCKLLRENIDANAFNDRCSVFEMAVADFDGWTQLHVPPEGVPTSASLDREGFRQIEGQLIRVRVTRIDSLSVQNKKEIVVKIDVEGFEHGVIRGMRELIVSDSPVIVAECVDKDASKKIEIMFKDLNYNFYNIGSKGIKYSTEIVPSKRQTDRNYLFLPAHKYGKDEHCI